MTTILLVDDEPMILRVMRSALEKAGYQVDTATNGIDALSRIEDNHPDILVTDIEMPRMTGKELCLHIEKMIPERKFPIFVATSLTSTEHRVWSRKIPNLIFLEKPISIRKLRSAISEIIVPEEAVNP